MTSGSVARAQQDAAFDAILNTAPRGTGDIATARMLGAMALDLRREQDALALLSRSTREVLADPVVQHLIGLLYRAIGDLAPALAAFDRAVAVTPNDARLIHARARAASEAGLDCLEWFARARTLAPNDGDVILGYAGALVAAGRKDDADHLVHAMLRLHPGWLPGHEMLIQLRYAWNDPDWLDALDAAITGAPGDWRLHRIRINVLLRAGLVDRTCAALETARLACGDSGPFPAQTAIVATEQNRLADADAAFARCDPLAQPGTTVAWLRHLLRRGEPARVALLETDLADANRDVAWPYFSLAWRLLGDPKSAWLDDPRLVAVIDLGTDWPEFARLPETLRALHIARGQPLDQSVRGGSQTDGPLLARIDPVIAATRARLSAALSSYIANLPAPDPDHPLLGHVPRNPRFVGSWSVRLTGGGFHEPHVHGDGWLSSAFYVGLPDRDPNRCARDAESSAGALALGMPQASLGVDLPPQRLVAPRPGRLVLFPSTVWHGTLPFSDGERLTIAFDIA